ncbi:MAG: M56 family metallopeptidase [Pseudomonadales bacterium]|nr:M56 family metallopeptidase [Pseudomonadales bacterium]
MAQYVLQALLSWLVITIAASRMAAFCYPYFRSLTMRGAASDRSVTQLTYGALGPLVASLGAMLMMHPETAAIFVPEHCHADNCLPHRPEISIAGPVGAGIVLASLAAVLLTMGAFHGSLVRAWRRLRALRALAINGREQVLYQVVDDSRLLAWCAGILRPRIFLSTGLITALSKAELEIVLNHERAHARRRDNLRHLLLHWLSLPWTATQRQRLLADFASSTESACDQMACRRSGDHDVLMALLRRLQHAQTAVVPGNRLGFHQIGVEYRIKALAQPRTSSLAAAWVFIGMFLLTGLLLLTGMTHRALEVLTRI